jgi:hypothetical protein
MGDLITEVEITMVDLITEVVIIMVDLIMVVLEDFSATF